MTAPTTNPVSVRDLPPIGRLNLRIDPDQLSAASAAFGVAIPPSIGAGAQSGPRAAYCLGPDEWLLHAPEDEVAEIVAAFDTLREATPNSLVEISDRECAILISGPAALDLLAAGCPLDLSRMDVGAAKRTVFDSAQVVLIREGEDAFRLEVWRSFYPHVRGLIDIVQAELAAGL